MDELLTVAEAAQATKLSIATWRAWILKRKVGTVRLGRRVFILRKELERLVSEGKMEAVAQ